ncbi:FAD binding domain-containing protein [Desarmillaria tabescens]|uniref:FAD binding domain-containing protein n=1 Tax=Armillaria tabescens TaxID=1929756 RepID=A0AA39NJK8_ARMTA|nr:FAD binding domain-containing protein [Desarmillaria tabescens]KAK0466825.1 FAD binding domain-containing protein [Desarmillaria tabescens]
MSPSALAETSVDVLIVGAGPAGLMLANGLAKAGVNFRIIDKRPDKVVAGQADGIQPRTIEVLQSYGLAQRLLGEGNQIHMAAFYNPSADGGIKLTDRVPDITAENARYPFEVTLHQGAIEAIFLDSLRSMGIQVERPVVPISMEITEDVTERRDPNAHAVRVTLSRLDPAPGQAPIEIVNAKFVVGADGAHSWVRKSLNLSMDGEQTEYIWGVVDMIPDTDLPDIRNKTAIHSINGSCMVIPREGDKIRLYIQLEGKDAINAASGRVDKSKMGPERLLEVARRSFYPYTIKNPKEFDWWTIYIIGQRVASRYSVGERVFIAGDACHTHSPKAGQGMNASINDTHNLAWKLAYVLRGWADLSLLKTYESERRRYAQDLINFDKKFAKLFSGKPITKEFKNGVSHEEFLRAFQTSGAFSSGIGVHYSESSIVNSTYQDVASKLVIGMRIPPEMVVRAADSRPFNIQDLLPSDARFKLIVFTGDTSSASTLAVLQQSANELQSVLTKYCASGPITSVFDIISISSESKATILYNALPPFLRSHWTKVYIADVNGLGDNNVYTRYGVAPEGAVVVVRPDGYVGMVIPLRKIEGLNSYFESFMGC